MSEGLAIALRPLGIGVTVICPGFVRTRLSEAARHRPERYGPAQPPDPASPLGVVAALHARLQQAGLDPATVAARTLAAIREDALYVFTHPDMAAEVKERFATILAAMDKAAAC
jgi:NAD(P)-dependent dehydrogenase (short-subunit alcohol dehydrogenase family)